MKSNRELKLVYKITQGGLIKRVLEATGMQHGNTENTLTTIMGYYASIKIAVGLIGNISDNMTMS